MRPLLLALATSTVGALLAVSHGALAQDEAAIAAARALGQEGALAAQAGRCDEAIEKLGRAKRIIPAPTILLPLGECQISQGKIVVGTENLQTVAREVLKSSAPQAFVDAQNRARQLLPDALKKLSRLRIDVLAPAGVDFEVTDNGEVVGDVLVGVERPADPTKHVIVVTAPGYFKATAEVTLSSGQQEKVELELKVDPNAPKPPPPQDTPPGTVGPPTTNPPPPPEESSPLVPVGAAALGLGGAGLIVGAIFGGLATGKKSDLDQVCVEKRCPNDSQGDIDELNTFGNVSTVSLIVGGATAVLGATLLGVGLTSGSSTTTETTLLIQPGGLGLFGRFQ